MVGIWPKMENDGDGAWQYLVARDGDGSRQWSTVLIRRWGTSSAVALLEMKEGRRWRTTVAGSCETVCRNRKNDGAQNGGRRWEDFGVDREREGKFGGKLGKTKMRKMGGMNWFCCIIEIFKFFFLKKKNVESKMALST